MTAGGRTGGRYSPLQKKVCGGSAPHLPIASSFFNKISVTKHYYRSGPRNMKIEYISWPLTTHKLPKKHYEARLSERLPTYPLSQIDYRHNGYN